jgi:hypothetical protein
MLALPSGPAVAGPPFRIDDAGVVEYQHWEMNLFSTGTRTSDGMIGVLPGFDMNYGVVPGLQLHAIVGLGYQAATGRDTGFGPVDLELGVKYRLLDAGEDDWFPQITTAPLVEVPAGNQKLGLSTGHAQVFLPLWLQKDFDPWSVYGGGGYWLNPGAGNRNFWFFGVAVWRSLSETFRIGAELFHQTANVSGGKDTTGMNIGVIYDLSERWHVLASAGTGLQNARSTDQFTYYAGVQLTF